MSDKIIAIRALGFPWETQDPFLFCVHHRDYFPEGNGQMEAKPEYLSGRRIGNDFQIKDGWRMYHGSKMPGFPVHPHRGFETITINKEGVVDHTDSLGAAGRFMKGDVQWMTAGKGVQHSEMFPLLHDDKPNTMEIFQIWLNLPKKSKMVEPHFRMLWREDIPKKVINDSNGNSTTIDVIAGVLDNTNALAPTPESWAADESNDVGVFTVEMEANAEWSLRKISSGATRTVFFYEGDELSIEGKSIKVSHLVKLKPEEEIQFKNGDSTSKVLILEGMPIKEPVAQYGPFVMNSQAEIEEAFNDFRKTEFGGWPWPKNEYAHPKGKGRFALHADGTEVSK